MQQGPKDKDKKYKQNFRTISSLISAYKYKKILIIPTPHKTKKYSYFNWLAHYKMDNIRIAIF